MFRITKANTKSCESLVDLIENNQCFRSIILFDVNLNVKHSFRYERVVIFLVRFGSQETITAFGCALEKPL